MDVKQRVCVSVCVCVCARLSVSVCVCVCVTRVDVVICDSCGFVGCYQVAIQRSMLSIPHIRACKA